MLTRKTKRFRKRWQSCGSGLSLEVSLDAHLLAAVLMGCGWLAVMRVCLAFAYCLDAFHVGLLGACVLLGCFCQCLVRGGFEPSPLCFPFSFLLKAHCLDLSQHHHTHARAVVFLRVIFLLRLRLVLLFSCFRHLSSLAPQFSSPSFTPACLACRLASSLRSAEQQQQHHTTRSARCTRCSIAEVSGRISRTGSHGVQWRQAPGGASLVVDGLCD